MPLTINDYSKDIALFEEYLPPAVNFSKEEKEGIVNLLLETLQPISKKLGIINPKSYAEKRKLLHATLNILESGFLKEDKIHQLNCLLQSELKEKKITNPDTIPIKKNIKGTNIGLYHGDITTLKVDAIVNAANSRLLGCFQPLHACIDNAIHSNAGVQLRDDCQTIMKKQKSPETTGKAKITRAYNLPSNFVIHTVGPIVQTKLNQSHEKNLTNSYLSCLDICKEVSQIRSIAFCCISTGVFGYPPQEAAQIAYQTVVKWLESNSAYLDKLVFNVFSNKDLSIYESLMNYDK